MLPVSVGCELTALTMFALNLGPDAADFEASLFQAIMRPRHMAGYHQVIGARQQQDRVSGNQVFLASGVQAARDLYAYGRRDRVRFCGCPRSSSSYLYGCFSKPQYIAVSHGGRVPTLRRASEPVALRLSGVRGPGQI